jgi:formate/nitrite transporter
MDSPYRNPTEITKFFIESGLNKDRQSIFRLILLGILGGAFIAFASEGSNTAIHTVASVGLGKALAGALFATGLMLVVLAGGELFTGNMLMIVPALSGKLPVTRLLRNWSLVYAGNFFGSVMIAGFIILSGQFDFSGGLLGAFTIKVAVYKVSLTFTKAFFMGILCNWLVCLAVWMAGAAKDAIGKLFGIFFPIWLFITSGFEHSIANMYYIPAGILAKANPIYVEQASSLGVTAASLEQLTWGRFFLSNLLPVTLGNMVGGIVFVGLFYWLAFIHQDGKPVDRAS